MPGGICGTWPAFWTVGPNWPDAGEIDIIEGVNSQSANSMALHTSSGCSISNNAMFSGSITTPNCDVNAMGQATNAGCQIATSNRASYGAGFNQGQGGVFATEWTGAHISIWFFPRGSIPSDISSGSPDPSSWGTPEAAFVGGCNIDQFFSNQQIVFDTTFCGDWAGNVWNSDPVCSSKASTCQSFVQNNPSAFADAYWTVNSLKVYQSGSGGSNPLPGSGSSASAGIPGGAGVPTASSGFPGGAGVPTASAGFPGGAPVPAPSPAASQPSAGEGHSRGGGGGGGRFTKSFGAAGNFFAVSSNVEIDAVVATDSPNAVVAVAVETVSEAVPAETLATSPIAAAFFAGSGAATPTTAEMPVEPVDTAAAPTVVEVQAEASSAPPADITVAAVADTGSAPAPPRDNKEDCLTVSALGFEDFDHQSKKRDPALAALGLEVSALKRDESSTVDTTLPEQLGQEEETTLSGPPVLTFPEVPNVDVMQVDHVEEGQGMIERRDRYDAPAASGFREVIVKRGAPLLNFPRARDLEAIQQEEDVIERRDFGFGGVAAAVRGVEVVAKRGPPLMNFSDQRDSTTPPPPPGSAAPAGIPEGEEDVVVNDDDGDLPLLEEIREIKPRSRHQHLRFHRHLVKHGINGR